MVGSAAMTMGAESDVDGARCDAMQKMKGRIGACHCGPDHFHRGHARELESCSANVLVQLLVG